MVHTSTLLSSRAMRLLVGGCGIFFFVLGIKMFREPDLWWQIHTGQWIIDNGKVPSSDTFSYTATGASWVNIKWGFEILAAAMVQFLGEPNIYLLQALVNVAMLLMLVKTCRVLFKFPSTYVYGAAIMVATVLTGIGAEYRMIGRPEMFSHFFTITFVLLLEQWRSTKHTKYLYVLVPLQCLWANMHEAFGTGIAILIVYLFAMIIQQKFIEKKLDTSLLKKMALTTLLCVVAIAINPRGPLLLYSPFEIFMQVHNNKFTTELTPLLEMATWPKEVYIAFVPFAALLIMVLTKFLFANSKHDNLLSIFGLPYIMVCCAFAYLSFSAHRNVGFLVLLMLPVWVYLFYKLFNVVCKKKLLSTRILLGIATTLLILAYTGIVSNWYYKYSGSRDRYGLGIPCNMHPQGATEYIAGKGLATKKCFSDYITSSYLMRHLSPSFKTYIDLRDLDVFAPAIFSRYLQVVNDYRTFLDEDYHQQFDYVVLQRTNFPQLHAFLYNDSVYACTYVDQVAAVYEKTDHFSRADIFNYCNEVHQNRLSKFVSLLLNPFYKIDRDVSVNNELIAAQYYTTVGRLDLANARIQKALAQYPDQQSAIKTALGDMMMKHGIFEQGNENKMQWYSKAASAYGEAMHIDNKNTEAIMGMASAQFYMNNFENALSLFENMATTNRDMNAYAQAIECCKAIATRQPQRAQEMMEKQLNYCTQLYKHERNNPVHIMNLGYLYYNMGDKSEAKKYLLRVANHNLLSPADRAQIAKLLLSL